MKPRKIKVKWLLILVFGSLLPFLAQGTASAIPTLQLDIFGGTYDSASETIIAPGSEFTLYAYLIPNDKNTLDDWYYISAALIPPTNPPGDSLGYFVFESDIISVTSDMFYGVPPLETILGHDPGDLPSHGIFETYCKFSL